MWISYAYTKSSLLCEYGSDKEDLRGFRVDWDTEAQYGVGKG